LLALITPNKNGRPFYKNLEAMIGVTSVQLPKYATKAITSIKARPIPPLKMGKEDCQQIREASGHSKKIGPKNLPNARMNVE